MTRFWTGVVLAVVLLVRLLFMATYPLNDFGGDTHNYGTMLLQGQSSLVHAGGYPFLVGLPFRVRSLQTLAGKALPYVILVLQHAIDFVVLVFLYRVTSRLFGRTAGLLAVLLEGFSIQRLSATSATYPEWLQADLLVLALGGAYYAFVEPGFRRKLWLYSAAAFAFTLCVLVKFNAAVLGFFLLVALGVDSLGLRRKLVAAATCAAVCIATIAPYVFFYQYRTTGTYALTYDTAWVLLTRIQGIFHNTLDPEAGPDTRRWLALSSVLPKSYEFAGPGLYSHVNAIPQEVRAPYRARFGYLLSASDQKVRAVLARKALPPGFSVGLSAIPVAYYLGLPESDHLGVRVAFEAICADPGRYLGGVLAEVKDAIVTWPTDVPFASASNMGVFGAIPTTVQAFGYVRLNQRPDYWNVPFSYSVPALWWPGVRLFTAMNDHGLPTYWPSIAVGLALLVASIRIARIRGVDLQVAVTILLALMVVVMLVDSVATLAFRWKEARLVMPLVAILAGAAVGQLRSLAIGGFDGSLSDQVSAVQSP